MTKRNRAKLSVERLEDRLVPAINIMTDSLGNATISYAGPLTQPVAFTQTANNTFTITEGANTAITGLVVPGNLTIDFSHSSGPDFIFFDLGGNTMSGGLTVREGLSGNAILFPSGGTISGNVSLSNFSIVNTDNGAPVNIGGNFTVQDQNFHLLGALTLGFTSIGGNFSVTAGNGSMFVNSVETDSFGGNISINLGNGNNFLGLSSTDTVGGSVTYIGGSGGDTVSIGGTVGGSVYANLGTAGNTVGVNANEFDQTAASGGSGGVIGKNLTIIGGAGTNTINLDGLTAGSAYFNLGIGARTLNFNADATIDGPSITYAGTGPGSNTISFLGTTARSNASFTLGNSADTFTLGAGTNLALLSIDFGIDAPGTHDTFNNMAGATQPRLILRNLG
jgi:hypothetical protein